MSFEFSFSHLLGQAYTVGDVAFAHASKFKLYSPCGHRLSCFDLAANAVRTFPVESKHPLRRVAVSARLLVVCDARGRGMFLNPSTGAVLHRFNLDGPCASMQFSPDGNLLACAVERKVQLWAPAEDLEIFSPLTLQGTYGGGHSDDVTCLAWLPDGRAFVTGARDTTLHVHSCVAENHGTAAESATLTGHKAVLVGVFAPSRPTEAPCIVSVAEDGAVFEWRYATRSDDVAVVAHVAAAKRARRRQSASAASSSSSSSWALENKHYVQQSHAKVTAAAANDGLLLLGFDDGVFALHELPSVTRLHSLSVSRFAIETCALSPSGGAWLALGAPTMGQLVVWEWQSESFVLKQQGHYYNVNAAAYSVDGRLLATGGDDAKLKVWVAATGLCLVTFTEHEGPVTAVAFNKEAVLSASLDGTVRAFDLVRMREFRVLKPTPSAQLTCLALDDDVVCAGAMEPGLIFVWSLRTGALLDKLAGHEGPVASIAFSSMRPVLASASWDGTIKTWEPYRTAAAVETFKHGDTNALAVAFRPDGKELCSAGLDGRLCVYDVDKGELISAIDGARDLQKDAHFSSVCYSADGQCVLAGGRSAWVCVYQVATGQLVKKYQLSHAAADNAAAGEDDDDDDEEARRRRWRDGALPGATRGHDAGKRIAMAPDLKVACVRFSPTGRAWAAASNQGLVVYSLDHELLFEPVQLDVDVTPAHARAKARRGEWAKALLVALNLGEDALIDEVVAAVPLGDVELVARSVPAVYLARFVEVLAARLDRDARLQFNLAWAVAVLRGKHAALQDERMAAALRQLQKAVVSQERRVRELAEANLYDLEFLLPAGDRQPQPAAARR